MLLKLLKYDFRAMWKQFSLIWGAALVLALVNRFTIDGQYSTSKVGETTSGIMALVYGAVIVAMFVIAIIYVIQRFSKGLLGDEGYLMHTLPVRAWELVASKLICGTVTWIASGAVALLSLFLMAPVNWSEMLQVSLWRDLIRGLVKHPDTVGIVAEVCLVMIACIVLSIALIYLSLALGHLSPRKRKLVSFAAFIGLYILLTRFFVRFWPLIQIMIDMADDLHDTLPLLIFSAAMLIPAIVFLAATSWILENKLNLE